MNELSQNFTSTRNPCKACTPLGAALAFAGIEGAVPLLHGSQGCSTYIRRYLIGHFREPMDIASSNFHESSAVFGGRDNLRQAIANVMRQYTPDAIGIATTCLSETIGDDVPMILNEIKGDFSGKLPHLIPVSTPSYQGSHTDGFHATTLALVMYFAENGWTDKRLNIIPGIVSPEDIRHLKEIVNDFVIGATVLPDYSDTLDGPAWESYHKIPEGGTSLSAIKQMGRATATLEFTATGISGNTAGAYLEKQFDVPNHQLPLPMSMRLTDRLFATLEAITGQGTPRKYAAQRGRLLDSFVDGHKYIFEKKALVYGEEDLVIGLTSFLTEIGITPVLCATGAKCKGFSEIVRQWAPDLPESTLICDNTDFKTMEGLCADLDIDLLVGNSNGYKISRTRNVPLVRVGIPVHDRIGAARLRTLGYGGMQQMYDRIVNAFIERQQDESPVGYTHI